ncbi:hypothetical protein [Haladaptatus sp. CMAA 1911]|uniref:DUF7351 domain-containing protein n=1 Tax=Haladaptatus sp. CMAA 1911 TaxID=3368987 RepID=UPI003754AED3
MSIGFHLERKYRGRPLKRSLKTGKVTKLSSHFAVTDRHLTVRSTDPWEVALRVTLDGDALELVVDEDLRVGERSIS